MPGEAACHNSPSAARPPAVAADNRVTGAFKLPSKRECAVTRFTGALLGAHYAPYTLPPAPAPLPCAVGD